MQFEILLSNLTNPTILFFLLGMIAIWVKSDLQIPESTAKFISLYLLFSIGFKGGQELSHSGITPEILKCLLFGIGLAAIIPGYTFFILKRKLSVSDSGAIAAAYGSVSAVTFVAAMAFLEMQQVKSGGHMVAVMALMESPAIIVGVILMNRFANREEKKAAGSYMKGGVSLTPHIHESKHQKSQKLGSIIAHSFTNGSVLMIFGSLIIGFISDGKQAEGIKPFTTDIFKGFLAIFLLEMGMVTAKRFSAFRKYGAFVSFFAILIPCINGMITAYLSGFVTSSVGDRFIFSILAASASYIAVPAAMKLAAPKADPGLYIPMALGVTFPFNITIGMPLYYAVIQGSL